MPICAPQSSSALGAPSGPGLADTCRVELVNWTFYKKARGRSLLVQAGQHVTHPSELISKRRLKQLLDRVSGLSIGIIVDSRQSFPSRMRQSWPQCVMSAISWSVRGLRLPQSRKRPARNCKMQILLGGVEQCEDSVDLVRITSILTTIWVNPLIPRSEPLSIGDRVSQSKN